MLKHPLAPHSSSMNPRNSWKSTLAKLELFFFQWIQEPLKPPVRWTLWATNLFKTPCWMVYLSKDIKRWFIHVCSQWLFHLGYGWTGWTRAKPRTGFIQFKRLELTYDDNNMAVYGSSSFVVYISSPKFTMKFDDPPQILLIDFPMLLGRWRHHQEHPGKFAARYHWSARMWFSQSDLKQKLGFLIACFFD